MDKIPSEMNNRDTYSVMNLRKPNSSSENWSPPAKTSRTDELIQILKKVGRDDDVIIQNEYEKLLKQHLQRVRESKVVIKRKREYDQTAMQKKAQFKKSHEKRKKNQSEK